MARSWMNSARLWKKEGWCWDKNISQDRQAQERRIKNRKVPESRGLEQTGSGTYGFSTWRQGCRRIQCELDRYT